MSPEAITDLLREAIYIMVMIVSVMIVPSLIVGLIVSVFQAATQINEQTLSFLPRLLVTFGTLIVFGPWMANELVEYTTKIITEIPTLLG
jgi:flagellar biosynthetic protein FliQ